MSRTGRASLTRRLSALLLLAAAASCAVAGRGAPRAQASAGGLSAVKPELQVMLGHANDIDGAVFSSDGRLVASGGDNGVTVLWDAASGKELRRFASNQSAITALAFSPDNHYLATGSSLKELDEAGEGGGWTDDSVYVWDVRTGQYLVMLSGFGNGITSLEFSRDGRRLLVGSYDSTVSLWNWRARAKLWRYRSPVGPVRAARFTPVGRQVLVGSGGDEPYAAGRDDENKPAALLLLDASTGRHVRRLEETSPPVRYIDFSADGLLAVTSSAETDQPGGEINLWDVASWSVKRRKLGVSSGCSGPVSFSPDGRYIAVGDVGEYAKTEKDVTVDVGGTGLLGVDSDERIRLKSAATRLVASANPSDRDGDEADEGDGAVVSVAFSGDGKRVLTVTKPTPDYSASHVFWSGRSALRLYDVSARAEERELVGLAEESKTVAWSHDGRYIFTGRAVWDITEGHALDFSDGGAPSDEVVSALAPDGLTAVGISPSASRLLDTATQAEVARFEAVEAVWFSSDATLLFTWRQMDVDEIDFVIRDAKKGTKFWQETIQVDSSNAGRSWYNYESIDLGTMLSGGGRYLLSRNLAEDAVADLLLSAAQKGMSTGPRPVGMENVPFFAGRARARHFRRSGEYEGTLESHETATGKTLWSYGDEPRTKYYFTAQHFVVSPDERYVLAGGDTRGKTAEGREYYDSGQVRLLDANTGRLLKSFDTHSEGLFAFSPDSKYFAIVSFEGSSIEVWDVKSQRLRTVLSAEAGLVNSVAFSPDARYVLTGNEDGTARVWDVKSEAELCRLISLKNGDWVAVEADDGRFDSNNLRHLDGLNWVIAEEPERPLPVETFMRDYYEPRLLARLVAGHRLPRLPDLRMLNRTPPLVSPPRVSEHTPGGEVTVEVEVESVASAVQRDARGRPLESGIYDVRLFRDGQLVGSSTSREALERSIAAGARGGREDRREWRMTHFVPAAGGRVTISFKVRLPLNSDAKSIEFTAYAFNADRVKSATASKVYDLPPDLPRSKGRAYIVSVGVNANEQPRWDLLYAARDARRMQEQLKKLLEVRRHLGEYLDVVAVPLVSDYATAADGQRTVEPNDATKRNFADVIGVLAGRVARSALEGRVENWDRLQKASPEDLVIISFSGHGFNAGRGAFFLVPYDTGPAAASARAVDSRGRYVSSDELSLWLGGVDAGAIVMIIDACHAGSATGPDFKPGPMGSRGLGQLAYDKGMRILAATQAEDAAVEVGGSIGDGLLSYALVKNGLEDKMADFRPAGDHKITLREWLQFGVKNVPELYGLIESGMLRAKKKDFFIDAEPRVRRFRQQPTLFDFARRSVDPVIVELPAS